ncbi:MAG: FAD-binding protein [Bosea sp. (in: a-proteobacteria)]
MATGASLRSWGGLLAAGSNVISTSQWLSHRNVATSVLPYGNGRSYGDSCLNDGGGLIETKAFSAIRAFDPANGLLVAEPGLLLGDLLAMCVPQGWFLPVTPGTRFVTLGGAVANDVHGKNHHRAGTFGCHVQHLVLARSEGTMLTCSPTQNVDMFAATIGGMGLTGLITEIGLQLMPITSQLVARETRQFGSLAEFFQLARASDLSHDYTVAWIDALASGQNLGRGVFFRANHAEVEAKPSSTESASSGQRQLPFPLTPPIPLINRLTLKAFNTLYRAANKTTDATRNVPYGPFFYPLDRIANWNRAYGPKGLRQFQCVLPMRDAPAAITEMLRLTQRAGEASFLTVLKLFGDKPSPGLMSFPKPGATLTLDFPNRGARTEKLLAQLDAITIAAGGRVNPYKDARMSAATFEASFPHWRDFARHIDPGFSSSFWRRVTGE